MEYEVKTGEFYKVDGSLRLMNFVSVSDLPESFLDDNVSGNGLERRLSSGMELVWDLDQDAFRVFNHSKKVGDIKKILVHLDF